MSIPMNTLAMMVGYTVILAGCIAAGGFFTIAIYCGITNWYFDRVVEAHWRRDHPRLPKAKP